MSLIYKKVKSDFIENGFEFPIPQNIDLVIEFNKVKRFLIKDPTKIKAGIYINLRETIAFENNLVVVTQVHGKAKKDKSLRQMKFEYARSLTTFDKINSYVDMFDRSPGLDLGGIYVDTLCGYNLCFKFNAKVKKFIEYLHKQDRFQQHCVIKNKPCNYKSYMSFEDKINQHNAFSKSTRRW